MKFDVVDGEPSEENKGVLVKGMLAYHTGQGHPRETKVYSIFLKDEDDKAVGGVIVSFLWNGMHIDSLWVDESIRRQGWGRKLLEMAEEEAKKRECSVAYTDTFTWQAPEFYRKMGYEQYGEIKDFPEGNSLMYYLKRLTEGVEL